MALQLGALRDALLEAGATPEKAAKASEELAGYDIRLGRLETKLDVSLVLLAGLIITLIGSQFAFWQKLGEISGQLTALSHIIH